MFRLVFSIIITIFITKTFQQEFPIAADDNTKNNNTTEISKILDLLLPGKKIDSIKKFLHFIILIYQII